MLHADFETGSIKTEVISVEDLVETGSVAEARCEGKARMVGEDFIM